MPSLKKLSKADPRPLIVPFAGEVVTITYNRNAATPEALEGIRLAGLDADGNPDALRQQIANVDSLADVLLEWDVTETDEPGSPPLPITVENLRELPFLFHAALWDAIREDNRPPAMSSGSFGTG
jgi:hypothetical protein